MTYCESVGLKVGDKIRYLGDISYSFPHPRIRITEEITLTDDDGSDSPYFKSAACDVLVFDIRGRKWEKVGEPTTVTKDTIVDMQFTMEELFLIHTTVGSTSGFGGLANIVYMKVSKLIPLRNDLDTYHSRTGLVKDEGYDKWVASHFESPESVKAKALREEAAKLLKEADELEGK
jgi:hypothetical protein